MNSPSLCLVAVVFAALAATGARPSFAAEPIKLHPHNPHYFEFRGKPTILLTSGEHYGAVINLDFDYVRYLDALQSKGFNYTRAFVGPYREVPGSFGIERNTLAPEPNRLICPWARSDQPGYAVGGSKFDLGKWDDAYFARLKDFVTQAGKRGIVVELSLFCPYYERKNTPKPDILWEVSPLHAASNVNGVGTCKREEAHTLRNGNLLAVQEAMVRKIVSEMRDFDNVFYEICNEPYFGGVSEDWQGHIAAVIVKAEEPLPAKHLIAQNIANHFKKIEKPNPAVSIFNFHYAFPPKTVAENYALGKVIGDDETGFRGSGEDPYRTEAWDFVMAGGGLYNNLDYTFTTRSPDGNDTTNKAPGSTTARIRDQLAILREFINPPLLLLSLKPDDSFIKKGPGGGFTARALGLGGAGSIVYVNGYKDGAKKAISPDSPTTAPATAQSQGGDQVSLTFDLPKGEYRAEWVNTKTGKIDKSETFDHAGGERTIVSPRFSIDIALRIDLLRNG